MLDIDIESRNDITKIILIPFKIPKRINIIEMFLHCAKYAVNILACHHHHS